MAHSRSSQRPIQVRSEPGDPWFSKETEAIATDLLTETTPASETGVEYEMIVPSSRTHALAVWLVRTVARRGEPFTVEDLYRVVERDNVPMPQGTTRADVEPLLRRLEPDGERFSAPQAETGGQS
ncbi:hypothetical protein [Halococcus thailandensis]|uniref:Uncharacterized protein n=1 Tax=Halococcus thailandensis JCM 13552 TaxID=1227457 RepID=M0NH75_9EURY|nr:hypothetical protein [Halococcus thailandensis]EMA56459.1 hypothetical protein C451_02003 [Halococcus thailandensis JCM 13552]